MYFFFRFFSCKKQVTATIGAPIICSHAIATNVWSEIDCICNMSRPLYLNCQNNKKNLRYITMSLWQVATKNNQVATKTCISLERLLHVKHDTVNNSSAVTRVKRQASTSKPEKTSATLREVRCLKYDGVNTPYGHST